MAQLTADEFYAKWVPLLADNDFQHINGPRLAQLLADLRDSFASIAQVAGPAVRRWASGIADWKQDETMKIRFDDLDYFFTCTKDGGPFLAPDNANDTDTVPWVPAAPPTSVLSPYYGGYTLAFARTYLLDATGYATAGIDSYKGYGIKGGWNGGAADQVVYVIGLPGGRFDVEGTLLSGGQLSRVRVDVAAGTAVPAGGGGAANPYLEIVTTPGYRFTQLPVLPGFDIVAEVLDENAYAVYYQLDLNTRVGSRVYGTSGITLAQLRPALKVLTPAQCAAGVRLTLQTVATSPPDSARIGLDTVLSRSLALAPGTLPGFPKDPGAPVSLTINGHFLDPFVADETKGWNTSAGWYWDNLNLEAIAPVGANYGNSNGLYLFQVCAGFVNSASYYVSLLVADLPDGTPVSGSLYIKVSGQVLRVGPAAITAGRFFVPFTVNAASIPVSLYPGDGGAFTGAIKEFDIFRA